MLNVVKKGISHPEKIIENLGRRGLLNWMSDETYLKFVYFATFRKKLNLNSPQLFSEKLQWLKLHDRKPLYTTLVDKYEVKKYISNILGEKYIIPTLGVWDRFDDINFNDLPNQFVLKCTHDSGGLVICQDKNMLNLEETRKKINKSLKQNFFYFGREWPYKDVKPRIIAEKYMEDPYVGNLRDYKFYCFNRKPIFCQTISDRSSYETIDFFDMKWNLQEFTGITEGVEKSSIAPDKPENFDEMSVIVKKIAPNSPFSRIDFYEINGHVYFGEITFYPYSGFGLFRPQKWNKYLGDMIDLTKIDDNVE